MVRLSRSAVADVLTYTILTIAVLFATLPLLWGLSTSLKPESLVISAKPDWIPARMTLENYDLVFQSSVPNALKNSVFVSLMAVGLTLLVAVPAGYATARYRFVGRNPLMFYILATSMIPGIAVLVPLYVIAIRLHLHNTFTVVILIYAAWQSMAYSERICCDSKSRW